MSVRLVRMHRLVGSVVKRAEDHLLGINQNTGVTSCTPAQRAAGGGRARRQTSAATALRAADLQAITDELYSVLMLILIAFQHCPSTADTSGLSALLPV